MLSYLYRKCFCSFPIETHFSKTLRIIYHPHFDYCRIDFKEFNVQIVKTEDDLLKQTDIGIPAFIRYHFTTRNKTYYQSDFPKKKLKHNQVYADVLLKISQSKLLTEQHETSILTDYCLNRIIIKKFNKVLQIGIPQKIIIPKISYNFSNTKRDSLTIKTLFSTPALTEINKNMKQIYSPRPNDDFEIEKFLIFISKFDNDELVNAYNSQKAIYGVHQQLLYLKALDIVFKERFGKSPISNEDNTIFGLSGKIIYFEELGTFENANEN
ncbi:hypothetical protein [Epilithonimonas sp.]|uniref:hypothetical protein n=1 Tax=Epilithonimonas sp. TaxID=2894511 RepID=UPI0028AA00ED|nr:hypothetical protein [Epilithonimonas sp.]